MIDENEVKRAYDIANNARAMNFDPSDKTEIIPAPDLAARVEAIVGPVGVAEKIREMSKGKNRTQLAFAVAETIIDGAFGLWSRDKTIEQAVRTGTAIITEGVLVAPTEGISAVKINKNQDGTDYLAIYYAGPIRGAGGTSAALSVLLGDFARRKLGIGEYRPTDTAVERYVEEIDLYDLRGARLQYKPPEDDLRWIIRNCPVCIDGEPTEDFEVGAYRNVPGIETNRVRGGVCLVTCEGIAQKASKLLSLSRKLGMGWDWLETVIKITKTKEKIQLQPDGRYLEEVVAGRPIFAYPSRLNGFRLRYGRTRISGIHAKSVHPATMVILNSFIAIGTQLKIERPGKSATILPCDSIEPPIVKLDDGSVVVVRSVEEAIALKDRVSKILWLGDMLVGYGDFVKSNTPLMPAGYCEEWWVHEVTAAEKKLNKKADKKNEKEITAEDAFKISEELDVPLHPKYTFFWNNINGKEIKDLINWIRKVESKYDWLTLKEISVEYSTEKTILEKILLPHRVDKETILIDSQNAYTLLKSLNLLGKMDHKHVETSIESIDDEANGLDVISKLSGIKIRDKGGSWIGCRMGRPEKVKERPMKPPVHVLFPIANAGGKTRNVIKAYKDAKANKLKYDINVEVARLKCEMCGNITFCKKCELCGGLTKQERVCTKCGKISESDVMVHGCGGRTNAYEERPLNIVKHMDDAIARTKTIPEEMKGVIGMMSTEKIPEPIEKGIFRAKHGAWVFKDGTCRFDATNAPMTHFYPKEIGTSVERLRQLGYTKDAHGNELTNEDQLVELKLEDMVVSERCVDYLTRVSNFIDDTLVSLYRTEPYYKIKSRDDMIGQIVIELSPHTSCGILGRIIGQTKAHVCYAHPYMFCASRRDCFDGNTMMYYQNSNRLHTDSISKMFEKYSNQPKFKDGEWELIDLTNKNVFTLGADTSGNSEKKRVRYLMRKPYNGSVLKIVAENNQELLTTPDHRMWVFDPETKQLKEKRAQELTENDLLASLSTVEHNSVDTQTDFDLVNLFMSDSESEKITIRTDKRFTNEIMKKFGSMKNASRNLKTTMTVIGNSFYRKPYAIPLKLYKQIRNDNSNFRIGFKRNFGSMPLKIKVTDDLLRLIGYYVSEGWTWISKTKGKESYHVGFAASNSVIRKEIKELIKKTLNVPVYEDYKGVYITNKLCHKLFTNELKLGKGAYSKDIPDWILNLSDQLMYAFLGGCYQGDGNVYKREIKYCTVSESLASKIYFLLSKLGMKPTFKVERDRPTNSSFLLKKYEKLKKTPPITTLHYVCLYSTDSELFAKKVRLIAAKGKLLNEIKTLNFERKYIKSQKDIRVLKIKRIEKVGPSALSEPFVYDIQLEANKNKIFACGKGMLLSHNCDGDENSVMLLMDGLLNFSRSFLPRTRGGQMDAPLVLMTKIDPSEIDDQVYAMEICKEFPLEFYEATLQYKTASEIDIETVSDRLKTDRSDRELWFTHDVSSINQGVITTNYVALKSMREKIDSQLELAQKIVAVDAKDAAERVILSHFFPDLYGNMRSFTRQLVRCVDCNIKYRRPPLSGKCNKCGGKLILTINRGGIEKYLKLSQEMVEKYGLPHYLKQRLALLEKDIKSLFEDETSKQFNLAEFM